MYNAEADTGVYTMACIVIEYKSAHKGGRNGTPATSQKRKLTLLGLLLQCVYCIVGNIGSL